MTRVTSTSQRRAVVLADFGQVAEAERLAARLVIEGIGAEVVSAQAAAALLTAGDAPIGPTVVVARVDHEHASTLAHLFAEVDQGVSTWAPPPQDLWHGSVSRLLFGTFVVAVFIFVVLVLLVTAI